MSDTPRTDAEIRDSLCNGSPIVYADFARQLERELTQAEEELNELTAKHIPALVLVAERLRADVKPLLEAIGPNRLTGPDKVANLAKIYDAFLTAHPELKEKQ